MSLQDRILIVDDEAALRKTLRTSLSASGFSVEDARNGEEALRALQLRPFDLLLLDINMPGMNGIDACRRIREVAPRTGIIMITVRDLDDDIVRALEAGADDYVTKPFKLRELTARLRAVRRRTRGQDVPTASIEIGDLKIDIERRIFWKRGEEIHLSPKEFEILAFMMKNAGAPLTHMKILQTIWGPEYGGELEYLRSYVKMLRKKIEDDPIHPQYILTEPWLGYRFRDPSDSELQTEERDNL